jgi:hypothetical protein
MSSAPWRMRNATAVVPRPWFSVRWTYLPPLMVYLAAGLSGLTNIVGTFFVKDRLGLSAELIAALGFWVSLPWSLKMALGHIVDLIWRYKAWLVFLGAALVFGSTAIMLGLLTHRDVLTSYMPAETWYIASSVLAPIGYVLQDVVADAMTVEAVPSTDRNGVPIGEAESKLMHTTMQALGRGTLIAGVVLVSLVNLLAFNGEAAGSHEQRLEIYARIYRLALGVPLISVLGVLLAGLLRKDESAGESMAAPPRVDRRILIGGAAFAVVSGGLGISGTPHADLLVFLLSFAIVLIVMRELLSNLDVSARRTLIGTATALFVFRAMPDPGPGPTWWMIDRLGVDEAFLARLSALGSALAIGGLFVFRRWMAQRSVAFTIVTLTLAWTVIAMPTAGMYYGLHLWLAGHTGGAIDGRTIVIADNALLSLLSEIAMVPMLAWVARTAPDNLKATYFAVVISFTNLGFLVSRLATEYLNGVFVVTRETRDAATGAIVTPADYSQLGPLYITTMVIVLVAPLLTIMILRKTRFSTA